MELELRQAGDVRDIKVRGTVQDTVLKIYSNKNFCYIYIYIFVTAQLNLNMSWSLT